MNSLYLWWLKMDSNLKVLLKMALIEEFTGSIWIRKWTNLIASGVSFKVGKKQSMKSSIDTGICA